MVRCACQSVIAGHIFGIVLGPKKRAFFTTKNDFIFKGLPRPGIMQFTATAIWRCRLRFAGGSASEGSVRDLVSGSQKWGRYLVQLFGPFFCAPYENIRGCRKTGPIFVAIIWPKKLAPDPARETRKPQTCNLFFCGRPARGLQQQARRICSNLGRPLIVKSNSFVF